MNSVVGLNNYATHDQSRYPELWRGCVGAWAPCLGPTGGRLFDFSRNQNWGTLTNMDNATDWVVSDGRYALDFDGSNDYVAIPDQTIPTGSSARSICSWVFKPDDTTAAFFINTGPFIGQQYMAFGVAGNGGYSIVSNRELFFEIYFSTVCSAEKIALNRWTHCAIVYPGGLMNAVTFYIDGKNAGIKLGTILTPNTVPSNTSIGSRYNPSPEYGKCQLDDIRIYNRALSEPEIRLLATRRGIAYEPARRRRIPQTVAAFNAGRLRRQSLIGSGVY